MFRNVVKHTAHFTAKDETGRSVIIHESISFLFLVEVVNTTQVVFKPITYKNPEILAEIEKMILGLKYNEEIISKVVVRFGWMDKRLNKLSFMNLDDVIKQQNLKDVNKTLKAKFAAICKQLSISRKKLH